MYQRLPSPRQHGTSRRSHKGNSIESEKAASRAKCIVASETHVKQLSYVSYSLLRFFFFLARTFAACSQRYLYMCCLKREKKKKEREGHVVFFFFFFRFSRFYLCCTYSVSTGAQIICPFLPFFSFLFVSCDDVCVRRSSASPPNFFFFLSQLSNSCRNSSIVMMFMATVAFTLVTFPPVFFFLVFTDVSAAAEPPLVFVLTRRYKGLHVLL